MTTACACVHRSWPVGKAEKVDGGFKLSGHWRFSSGCHYANGLCSAVLCKAVLPALRPTSGCSWSRKPNIGSLMLGVCPACVRPAAMTFWSMRYSFRISHPPDDRQFSVRRRWPCPQLLAALPDSLRPGFLPRRVQPSIGALQAMLDAFVGYAAKRSGPAGKSADDPVAQQICAEVTAALDEMKLVLRRNMAVLWEFGERGEVPPLPLRQQYKFQSATVSHRCAELATRLMRATGAAGIYDEQPFGKVLADINAARQHIANQFEMVGRNFGASILGGKPANDMML
jgi:Acyl-CoA dehydrogenases